MVHVTSPNHLHVPQTKAILAAGKHVVCEKPLALTATESGELVRLAGTLASNPMLRSRHRAYYRVASGDSLWSISRRLGVSVGALVRANHLDPRATIERYSAFGKPLIIGEFSFRAEDSGLPNTKGAGPKVKTYECKTN